MNPLKLPYMLFKPDLVEEHKPVKVLRQINTSHISDLINKFRKISLADNNQSFDNFS